MSILKRLQNYNGQTPSKPGGSDSGGQSAPARRISSPGLQNTQDTYQDLKNRVQGKLLSTLDPSMDISKAADVRRTIQELFEQILNEENIVLSRPERARMFEQIAAGQVQAR